MFTLCIFNLKVDIEKLFGFDISENPGLIREERKVITYLGYRPAVERHLKLEVRFCYYCVDGKTDLIDY